MEFVGAAGLPNSMTYKQYSISILLCTIPFVGLWKGAPSLKVGGPTKGIQPHIRRTAGSLAVSSARTYLPQLSLDFTDLDARDAQNRPLQNDASQPSLTSLFLENLFTLTVAQSPHDLREAWSLLDAFSRLFHNAILIARQTMNNVLDASLNRSRNRFVHNVNNLWVTISVGVLFALFLSTNLRLQRVPQKLNLRC